MKVIDTLTQEDFHGAFQKLLERYNKCISAGGFKLNTIHHQGLRLALGAYKTSPIESFYAKANESPLSKTCLISNWPHVLQTLPTKQNLL